MNYKALKWLRVAVSAAFLLLLALCILDASFAATRIGHWLLSAQIMPAVLAGSALWIVLWVLVTLIFGRVYCSSACPMGTIQDCAGHMGRLCGKGAASRYSYSPPLNGLRFPIPCIVAFCLFIGFSTAARYTDPYAWYYRIVQAIARPAAIGFGSVAAAGIVLFIFSFAAWRRGRLICNTVCPIGGFLGLLSRAPVYRIDINTDKCIHCGKCEDVCKSSCINLADCTVDTSRCVMCMNCTAACPNDAITLRRGRYRLSTPLMQPTT